MANVPTHTVYTNPYINPCAPKGHALTTCAVPFIPIILPYIHVAYKSKSSMFSVVLLVEGMSWICILMGSDIFVCVGSVHLCWG